MVDFFFHISGSNSSIETTDVLNQAVMETSDASSTGSAAGPDDTNANVLNQAFVDPGDVTGELIIQINSGLISVIWWHAHGKSGQTLESAFYEKLSWLLISFATVEVWTFLT